MVLSSSWYYSLFPQKSPLFMFFVNNKEKVTLVTFSQAKKIADFRHCWRAKLLVVIENV